MSLSCLLPVCADLSHIIAHACAGKEGHYCTERKIYTAKSSVVSNVIILPYTCVLILSHILAHACAGKEGYYHTERQHKNIRVIFNVTFLPCTCVC